MTSSFFDGGNSNSSWDSPSTWSQAFNTKLSPSVTSSSSGGGNKWKDAFNLAGKYLQNSSYGDVNRYREEAKTSFGDSKSGGAFNLSPELNVVYPQQQAPLYVPGVEGKRGLGGTIGGLLGTVGGALIGGPAGASIGGSIGGGIGGLF